LLFFTCHGEKPSLSSSLSALPLILLLRTLRSPRRDIGIILCHIYHDVRHVVVCPSLDVHKVEHLFHTPRHALGEATQFTPEKSLII
jgi:hypothetical protein